MVTIAGVLGIIILAFLVAIAASVAVLAVAIAGDELNRIRRNHKQRDDMDRLEEMVRHPSSRGDDL